jgi:hypothetical protein
MRDKKHRLFCLAIFQKGQILTGLISIIVDFNHWEEILAG